MSCSPAAKRNQTESEVPKCPEDCVYQKSVNGRLYYCDYWEMERRMRRCDPGPECKRYVSKNEYRVHHRGKAPTWDTKLGKKMWEKGYTFREIGNALGTTRSAVYEYCRRNWGPTDREGQKKP